MDKPEKLLFLKMLIILHALPAPSPGIAVGVKKLQAQVILFAYLIGKIHASIRIRLTSGRRTVFYTVRISHIRIIERVDVNGQAEGMPGTASYCLLPPDS